MIGLGMQAKLKIAQVPRVQRNCAIRVKTPTNHPADKYNFYE